MRMMGVMGVMGVESQCEDQGGKKGALLVSWDLVMNS